MTAIDQTHPSCKKTLRGGGRPHMGFGLDLDLVGKGNNGHYAPFAWAA